MDDFAWGSILVLGGIMFLLALGNWLGEMSGREQVCAEVCGTRFITAQEEPYCTCITETIQASELK